MTKLLRSSTSHVILHVLKSIHLTLRRLPAYQGDWDNYFPLKSLPDPDLPAFCPLGVGLALTSTNLTPSHDAIRWP